MEQTTKHFWVATYPFFESWLVIGPVPSSSSVGSSKEIKTLYSSALSSSALSSSSSGETELNQSEVSVSVLGDILSGAGQTGQAGQAGQSGVTSPMQERGPESSQEAENQPALFSATPFSATPRVPRASSADTTLGASSDNSGIRFAQPVTIAVYDPDGVAINTVTITPPADRTTQVDLDPLLGALKLEGGIKHCHIAITSVQPVWCRLVSSEGGSLQGQLVPVNTGCAAFFPLTFSSGRSHAIAVVNHGELPTFLKIRLFCGSRSPEMIREVPAHGSRLVSLTAEFGDLSSLEDGRQVQGYVRLTTKSEAGVGVQLIERARLAEQKYWYSAVS